MKCGEPDWSQDLESHEATEDLEVLEKLVAKIESYLIDALALLSEEDRALLVNHYALEGIPASTSWKAPELHTEEARAVALRRARLRFNETLESLLTGAIQHQPPDREALEVALRFVRAKVG